MFRGDSSERSSPRSPRMNSSGSMNSNVNQNNTNNRFRVSDSAFDNDLYFNDTSSRSTAANRHHQNAPSSENDVIAINPDMYKYQDLVHASALTRLEAELRDLIRSRPLSAWPEYDGNGGGYQAASGKYPLPLASNNNSAGDQNDDGGAMRLSADQLDPKKAYFAERSLRESAERIYSRSSIQRYILQRLAADLNAEKEVRRDFHSYEAFKVALASPESTKLDLIKPNVVERPLPLSSPSTSATATSATEREKREQQQQQRGSATTPLLSTTASASAPRNANNQQSEDGNGRGGSGRTEDPYQQGTKGQSNADALSQLKNAGTTVTSAYSIGDDGDDGVSSSSPAVYKPGSYSHQRAMERMKLEQAIATRRQQQQQRDERMRGEREGERYGGGGGVSVFSPDSYSSSSYIPNVGGNGGNAYSSLFPYREPRPRTFLGTHAYPNVDTDTVYLYQR